MSYYERFKDLPIAIERYELEPLSRMISEDWTRRTTVVHLFGEGHEGIGEDVSWSPEDQEHFQNKGGELELAGSWTFDSFSKHLAELDTFIGQDPAFPVYRNYREWAI